MQKVNFRVDAGYVTPTPIMASAKTKFDGNIAEMYSIDIKVPENHNGNESWGGCVVAPATLPTNKGQVSGSVFYTNKRKLCLYACLSVRVF